MKEKGGMKSRRSKCRDGESRRGKKVVDRRKWWIGESGSRGEKVVEM